MEVIHQDKYRSSSVSIRYGEKLHSQLNLLISLLEVLLLITGSLVMEQLQQRGIRHIPMIFQEYIQ